jgi:hypothetical protein
MEDLYLHSDLRGSETGLGYIDDLTGMRMANGCLMQVVRLADEVLSAMQQRTSSTADA